MYILHGDDELAISDFVKGLFDSLGDPSMAEMNTTRLDGRTHTLDDLVSTANAISFLAPRRLVIFERPLERIRPPKRETDPQVDQPADSGSQQQKKFLAILEARVRSDRRGHEAARPSVAAPVYFGDRPISATGIA